ncbi:MAG: thioesterase family protein [Bacteroidota bacterium]
MFISETNIRVRYGETDQMGYVYYGNYALYYEVGRVEALRKLGMSYFELEEFGVMMPVVKMECNYVKAAKYDDLLTVKVIIDKMPGIRFHFYYEISNASGVLINKGETTLVFIDMKTNKVCKCPQVLEKKMEPFFTNG